MLKTSMAPIRPLVIFFSPDWRPLGCLDDQGQRRQCHACTGCAARQLLQPVRKRGRPVNWRTLPYV